jgi:hypothetical protein
VMLSLKRQTAPQRECPFYLNPRKRVNTILTHSVRRHAHARSDLETTSHRHDAAAYTRAGAKLGEYRAVADREKCRANEDCYGLGSGVG